MATTTTTENGKEPNSVSFTAVKAAHAARHLDIGYPVEQNNDQSLIFRLRERARIRRQIPTRKSVQENKPDRIADLLEEAAEEIERLKEFEWMYRDLQK